MRRMVREPGWELYIPQGLFVTILEMRHVSDVRGGRDVQRIDAHVHIACISSLY